MHKTTRVNGAASAGDSPGAEIAPRTTRLVSQSPQWSASNEASREPAEGPRRTDDEVRNVLDMVVQALKTWVERQRKGQSPPTPCLAFSSRARTRSDESELGGWALASNTPLTCPELQSTLAHRCHSPDLIPGQHGRS